MAAKKNTENLNWEEAFEELNHIVESLESEETSIDALATKMKRASYLITFCSSRLRDTEDAVNQIIREMDDPGPVKPDEDDEKFNEDTP